MIPDIVKKLIVDSYIRGGDDALSSAIDGLEMLCEAKPETTVDDVMSVLRQMRTAVAPEIERQLREQFLEG